MAHLDALVDPEPSWNMLRWIGRTWDLQSNRTIRPKFRGEGGVRAGLTSSIETLALMRSIPRHPSIVVEALDDQRKGHQRFELNGWSGDGTKRMLSRGEMDSVVREGELGRVREGGERGGEQPDD